MKYLFTGSVPEVFPALGVLLEPGQTVESKEAVSHPRLKPVKPEKATKESS